jgi:hypothetical protein
MDKKNFRQNYTYAMNKNVAFSGTKRQQNPTKSNIYVQI